MNYEYKCFLSDCNLNFKMNFVGTILFAVLGGVAASEFYSINPPLRTIPNGNPVQRWRALRTKRQTFTVDQQFKDAAVNAHNNARQSVNPAATNMHVAVWNEDLATTAQNYADQCNFAHNDDRTTQTQNKVWNPEYVGENLYISSYDYTAIEHMTESVRLWDAEKENYTYSSRACSSTNPGCGHYTQVVWHNSANIGCGIQRCPNYYGGRGVIVVCNYGPGGNYIGQHPYSTDSSVTPCTVNPCLHGGTCSPSGSSYSCSCTSEYQGTNCHEPTVCVSHNCQNGGTCVPSADATSYTCNCAPGFTGSTCGTAVPCDSQPCQNGGSCTANGATYSCSCTAAYVGTNCETALTQGVSGCDFESDFCGFTQTVTSFNWRRRSGSTPSPNTGPSSASVGSYYAYTEVSGTWPAGSSATLESSEIFAAGTWCLSYNYHMYGSSIGTLEVMAGGQVVNTLTGDQGNTWIPYANTVTSSENFKLAFKGIYGGGFTGDIAIDHVKIAPGTCDSTNPCSNNPCQNGGTCTASGSSYTCSCTSDFTGTNCDQANPCSPNPCQNGGICTASGSSYTCSCTSGFSGTNCDQANSCSSTPCLHGGTCTPSGSSHTCTCVPGYSGSSCETPVPCDLQPCQNGGTCIANGVSYTCNCASDYTGTNCESSLTQISTFECNFDSGNCGMIQPTSDDIDFQIGSSGSNKFLFVNGNAGQEAVIHTSESFTDVDRCVTIRIKVGWNADLLVLAGNWGYILQPSSFNEWIYRLGFPAGTLGGKELTIRAIIHTQNAYIGFDDLEVGPCPTRKRQFGRAFNVQKRQRKIFLEKHAAP